MRYHIPVCLAAIVLLAGCFTADVKLQSDGSGTLVVDYNPFNKTTVDQQRKNLSAPGITVEEIRLTPVEGETGKSRVNAQLSFKDVTKLSAAPHFSKFSVQLDEAGPGKKQLQATIKTDRPAGNWQPKGTCTIRVHLPGELIETSAQAEGNTVVWTFPTTEYVKKGELKMTAVYKLAAAAPEAGSKEVEN